MAKPVLCKTWMDDAFNRKWFSFDKRVPHILLVSNKLLLFSRDSHLSLLNIT